MHRLCEGLFQQTQVLVEVGPEILPVGLGSLNEVFDLKLGSTQMGLIRCPGTPTVSTQVCSGEGGPALWDPCLGNASQERLFAKNLQPTTMLRSIREPLRGCCSVRPDFPVLTRVLQPAEDGSLLSFTRVEVTFSGVDGSLCLWQWHEACRYRR